MSDCLIIERTNCILVYTLYCFFVCFFRYHLVVNKVAHNAAVAIFLKVFLATSKSSKVTTAAKLCVLISCFGKKLCCRRRRMSVEILTQSLLHKRRNKLYNKSTTNRSGYSKRVDGHVVNHVHGECMTSNIHGAATAVQ